MLADAGIVLADKQQPTQRCQPLKRGQFVVRDAGDHIVDMNINAVDNTLANLVEIKVPESWGKAAGAIPAPAPATDAETRR